MRNVNTSGERLVKTKKGVYQKGKHPKQVKNLKLHKKNYILIFYVTLSVVF